MTFVNPIELLELQGNEVSSIDSSIIKKSKRRLLAEIELADDPHFNYKGISLTKSDCEHAISQLESGDYVEFYHFIAKTPELNNFLAVGHTGIFSSFKQEGIYKLPEFVNFISPYFSDKFDKSLLKAYQISDYTLLKKIVSIQPLVKQSDMDDLYRSLTTAIKCEIEEVSRLINDIKNNRSIYDEDDVDEVYDWLCSKLCVEKLNLLPQYFQSTRNLCASTIRNLSVNVFNAFDRVDIAQQLLGYALEFNVDELTKQKLTKDYDQIQEIKERREEDARYSLVYEKYGALMKEIRAQIGRIENRGISVSEVVVG